MRLWTLHPEYLDRQGLIAVWREGLLAQYVLKHWLENPEKPIGYRNHPQLDRFKETSTPLVAISLYLAEILAESQRRNYCFNRNKIDPPEEKIHLSVTKGQIEYERKHLIKKLIIRDPKAAEQLLSARPLKPHPLFIVVPGEIEKWEKR